MSERIARRKARLAESRATLNQVLDLVQNRADEQLYSDGAQWTIRQLAIHLALADKGHNQMLFHYAEGKEYIPADYDIDRYNKRSVDKSDSMTFEQARASLAESRAELLAWLDTLTDETILDKTGRHATLQIMSLSQIMEIMARHEEGHAKDMQAFAEA